MAANRTGDCSFTFFFFWHLRKQLTNSSFFQDRAQILSVRRGKTLKVTCGDPPSMPPPQSCVSLLFPQGSLIRTAGLNQRL